MKKIIIAVIGILLIAILTLPFVGGYKTEEVFNQWIAQVNRMGTYDLQWERYDKGWLQTQAVLKVGLNSSVLPALAPDESAVWYFPLNVELNHGPVLWLDAMRLGWFSGSFYLDEQHEMWLERNLQKEGDGRFFVSEVFMNLVGNATTQDHSLPFSVTTTTGETFEVSAYSGNGKISRGGVVEYSGKLPAFAIIEDEATKASVEDVALRIHSDFGRQVGDYVIPGNGEISIKKVTVKDDDELAFSMADFLVVSDVELSDDRTLADFEIKIAFANLAFLGEQITNAELEVDFANISTVFLDRYLTAVQNAYDGQGETDPMLFMQLSGLASEHLIPGGPELSIPSLTFTTPEGSLTFDGRLAVAPEAAQQMANPMAILSYLAVDASLLVDKPLAFRLAQQSTLRDLNAAQFEGGEQMTDEEKEELANNQAQMMLDAFTIQGMLIDQGANYTGEFSFKDGQAVLNGQPLPMPF